MFYRLIDRKPVKCTTGRQWVDWFENAGEALIVGQDEIGDMFLLTVFTGIDHGGSEEPQLFETLSSVDGKTAGAAILSATWDEAYRRHRKIVLEAQTAEIEDAVK